MKNHDLATARYWRYWNKPSQAPR